MKHVLLLLALVGCDGSYRLSDTSIDASITDLGIAPLGQTCDPGALPAALPGCVVCPIADFAACCQARPEHFACTCDTRSDGSRWYLGWCATPKETP